MAVGNKVKGITIEFNGETTKLERALGDINKKTKGLDSQLKEVDRALKFNPGNTELLAQKHQMLGQKVDATKNKLTALKEAQAKLDDDPAVEETSQEYMELRREIIETESKLKHFEKELRDIGNVKLTALGNQMKQVGSKMQTAGKSMTQYVTAPIVGGMGVAVKATMDFDSAMSQVAATMGKTNQQMLDEKVTTDDFTGSLRDLAIEMGSKTSFSATQAAEALNYMALAGYDAETSAKMLPKVLNLAAAGGMELATASDMITDSQTALGLSLEETNTLVDQMAKASSKSNTSVEQLGSAILTVGGTAKSMKGGTQELNTVLGILADNGVKGAEGGTALRNILLSLSAPTDKAAGFLAELGVSAFDADGNMRPMQDTMADLKEALKGLSSEEERTYFLANIFNKRDLKSVNALLGTSADRWNELSGAIGNAGGSAEQMADTQLDNLGGSITILKSALEGLAIHVGDVLTPYIKRFAEWITKLVDKFNGLSPTAQKIVVAVGAIAAAIGPLLVVGGVLISSIGQLLITGPKIIGMMKGIGVASKLLSGILTALPWMLVAAAAIAAIVLIVKNWDKIKGFFVNLWAKCKKIFAAGLNGIKSVTSTILKGCKAVIVTIFNGIKAYFLFILNFYKTIFRTAFNIIRNYIVNPIKSAVDVAKKIFGNLRDSVVSIAGGLRTTVANVFNGIKDAMLAPIRGAVTLIKAMVDKIKGFFNFNFKLPHIKLPHFSIHPRGWQIGDLLQGSIPSLGIDWYAKGGIFNSPSVIGVGEKGPEAVLPIDRIRDMVPQIDYDRLAQAVAAAISTVTVQGEVSLDGKTVGRVIAPSVNKRMYGQSVLDGRFA